MIQENEEYPKYEEKETEKDLPRNRINGGKMVQQVQSHVHYEKVRANKR